MKKFTALVEALGDPEATEFSVKNLIETSAHYLKEVIIVEPLPERTVELQEEYRVVQAIDLGINQVNTPYTFISDSSVRYQGGGFFEDVLGLYASNDNIFMVGEEGFNGGPYYECLFIKTNVAKSYIMTGTSFLGTTGMYHTSNQEGYENVRLDCRDSIYR